MQHQITDQTLTKFYKAYGPVLIAQNLAGIPSGKELERVVIPPGFDARIESLIDGLGCNLEVVPPKRAGKRLTIILVAALLAAATTVMTVSAAQEWLIKVVTKALNTHMAVSIYSSGSEEITPSRFTALPDGYQIFTEQTNDQTAYTVYTKPYGNIQLTESFIATDWEDLPGLQTATVNQVPVRYREESENRSKLFFWQYNDLYYTLRIKDQMLTSNDILAIIESMEYMNMPQPSISSEADAAEPFEPYCLTVLPEGYISSNRNIRAANRYLKESYILKNSENTKIQLTQLGSGSIKIDNEHMDEYDDTVKIHGESATYMRKKDLQSILFQNGKYYFIIRIQDSSIDKETAIQIAEGVAPAGLSS